MRSVIIGWWSAGITSTVACKIALELYDNVELVYIESGNLHPDNIRFKNDCEKWYGQEIRIVHNSSGYESQIDVIHKTKYVNGPEGARCTLELKKKTRWETEELLASEGKRVDYQVFGFEFMRREVNRAIRFLQQYPEASPLFPLVETGLDKDACAGILINAGIEIPEMYRMGYPNNNCLGCIKGGKGYWNKVRVDFPEIFQEMAMAERVAGHSCIRDTFLDELDPEAGRSMRIVMPNCGTFCEVELGDIEDASLDPIMKGVVSIYDTARMKLKKSKDY